MLIPQPDWSAWLHCTVCKANKGHPCTNRTSGGPDALAPIPRDRPHTARKPVKPRSRRAPQC